MFNKKRKKQKKLINEKYPLDDLYVAEMGINITGTIKSKETIICKCKKDSYGHHIYTDILTKNKYRLYTDIYAEKGETIVFNPRSFMSVFRNGEYKDNLLKAGSVNKEQLIQIYNALNDNKGYIESREDKKKNDLIDACDILTDKEFTHEPTIHQEEELEKLMISLALNKKIALIVGNKGSGTTSLVEELAYLIQKKQVPDFLRDKTILEVNIASLKLKETKIKLENRIKTVIDAAKENNSIIFIDEADDIVTPKEEIEENMNVLALLRHAAERQGIKIIATTNQNRYKEYAQSLEFKRQFDVIEIKKHTEEELKDIINRDITNKSKKHNISTNQINELLPDITTLLLSITSANNTLMITNDENPGLVLSIIDKTFAIAKVSKEKEVSLNHFQRAITEEKQLDQNKRKKASDYIDTLKEPKEIDKEKEKTKK